MKFMNMKRFGSIAMAGAMAMSLTAPAFAGSTPAAQPENSTKFETTFNQPEIAVTVPQSGNATINPFGLPVMLGEEVALSGQPITSLPVLVENRSPVALAVSASVKSTVKGSFTFSDTAIADNETGNKGNVKFQMFPAPGVTEGYDIAEFYQMFADLTDDTAGHDAAKDITLKASASGQPDPKADNIIVLREASGGELQNGGAAFFRLSGTVAKRPTTAWVAADGFEALIQFSFEPSEYVMAVDDAPAAATGEFKTVGQTKALTMDAPTGVTVDPSSVKWFAIETVAGTNGGPSTTKTSTYVKVTDAGSTATQLKGTAEVIKLVSSGTTGKKSQVWVEFKGTDGLTYRSNTVEVTVDK